MPRLQVTLLKPPEPPVHLSLDAEVITVGRSSDCLIPIPNRYLSRRHAELVADGDGWVLRDNGSVNGTFVNGNRVASPVRVVRGDRIGIGDAELVIGDSETPAEPEIPDLVTEFVLREGELKESADRSRLIHRLALELISDRPMAALFDFILDRVVEFMHPSRTALALLSDDGQLSIVKLRPAQVAPESLAISRTLAGEVVRDRKVVVFTDDGLHSAIAAAASIVGQNICSALCAPLIAGDKVLGVLYVDYQASRGVITEDDAQLAAQIARVAAMKLESTRLREAAIEKQKLEEALELARSIQMRMLPQLPSAGTTAAFDIAAKMVPARQVGGDFYDFYATPDGNQLYVCIGDVSGKGIPAALLMAVSRALLRSYIMAGGTPSEVLRAVNRQLCDESDDEMFVTAFCASIDLESGAIRYANAGHPPPLVASHSGTARSLPVRPGLVLGCTPDFSYVEESAFLGGGEVLVLYTDGISEATNLQGDFFSVERLQELLARHAADPVGQIVDDTLHAVAAFEGGAPQTDDLTLLCVRFRGGQL